MHTLRFELRDCELPLAYIRLANLRSVFITIKLELPFVDFRLLKSTPKLESLSILVKPPQVQVRNLVISYLTNLTSFRYLREGGQRVSLVAHLPYWHCNMALWNALSQLPKLQHLTLPLPYMRLGGNYQLLYFLKRLTSLTSLSISGVPSK